MVDCLDYKTMKGIRAVGGDRNRNRYNAKYIILLYD